MDQNLLCAILRKLRLIVNCSARVLAKEITQSSFWRSVECAKDDNERTS
jgi:hypothetical protein